MGIPIPDYNEVGALGSEYSAFYDCGPLKSMNENLGRVDKKISEQEDRLIHLHKRIDFLNTLVVKQATALKALGEVLEEKIHKQEVSAFKGKHTPGPGAELIIKCPACFRELGRYMFDRTIAELNKELSFSKKCLICNLVVHFSCDISYVHDVT